MPINTVLSRLDKVKQTGHGKWLACCPAHDDNSPSLAIRETDDGRVLLHCFGGCHTSDILAAMEMMFGDLYPSTSHAHLPPVKKPFNANDALMALSLEVLFAWNCANMMANGETLPDSDRERLLISASRLNAAAEVLNA